MIDSNATNFLNIAISVASKAGDISITLHNRYELNSIGNFFVPWNGERVKELASGEKTSDHEWEQKLANFEKYKQAVLNGTLFDTTIIVATSRKNAEVLIIDGVHRAIGIQKALIEAPDSINKINLRVLMIISTGFVNWDEYKKILQRQKV